jgi:hypothetical protein
MHSSTEMHYPFRALEITKELDFLLRLKYGKTIAGFVAGPETVSYPALVTHSDIIVYAENVKQRVPELEGLMDNSPVLLYSYSCKVIKGRWPEKEELIKKHNYVYEVYCMRFGIRDYE